MPYTFAHPAAVLPLARPMGRFAVPSALAIGSMVPDLWYFVPYVARADSHSLAALAWFCIPAGLLSYLAFHLLLKEPLIALLSPRLRAFTCSGLPAVPWHSVAISLAVGALTHIAWDALTHIEGQSWLQHASTALGVGLLVRWAWPRLKRAPAAPAAFAPFVRACILALLAAAMGLAALASADVWPALDYAALRHLLRTAGVGAFEGLGAALFVYSVVWQLRARRAIPA